MSGEGAKPPETDFRDGVVPLADRPSRVSREPPEPSRFATKPASPPNFVDTSDGDWVELRADGERDRIFRDLGRARVPDSAQLDLHGLGSDDAADAVARFVRDAHARATPVVLIISGKGLHSAPGGGVLRDRVIATLTTAPIAPLVRAICSASATNGGTGALLVGVRRRV